MDGALGPGYDYWKNIKTPSELGMSDAGTIKALSNDISGLISYVSVLVDGNSNASKTGEPLGNRFLLKTMAKCRNVQFDKTSPESEANPKYVSRHIYVDNIPDGTIPFIASGPDGGKMKDFRGLIPGAIGNLSAFSPSGFYRAFTMGNYPDCIKIALRTKDNNNNDGVQTEYVAVGDILNEISPDNMPNGNPVNTVEDACNFRDYYHPTKKIQKTREECNPPDKSDGFSMLFNGRHLKSDSDSDTDSDMEQEPKTETEKEERRALKHMRKMRRVEKNLHQTGLQHVFGLMPRTTPTHSDTEFTSKYDDMRFDDDNDIYVPETDDFILPDDIVSRLYYATITGVGLYILYRLLYRRK